MLPYAKYYSESITCIASPNSQDSVSHSASPVTKTYMGTLICTLLRYELYLEFLANYCIK